MKKSFFLAAAIFICVSNKAQYLQVGSKIPDIIFENAIISGKKDLIVKNVQLSNFANKVILLDFWATWCGPCIQAIPKYEELQNRYKENLQIIMITHEPVKRIQNFLNNRPTKLMMAIDTTESLRKYFEYRSIPHIVLIDKTGYIKAITHADEVTASRIDTLLNGEDISVKLKKDNTKFNYEADFFRADSNLTESFNVQPEIKGTASMSKVGKGIFKDRRISIHNLTIDGLYQIAYQKSYFRTVYEKGLSPFIQSGKYCVDVIVPKGLEKKLYGFMLEKLEKAFSENVKIEKRKMVVHVLKGAGNNIKLKKSVEISEFYNGSSNFFTGNGVSISSLAEYLEKFGLLGTPVLDETGIIGRYDIHLEWEPEKKEGLKNAFLQAGFVIEKVEREIEVLVFY